MSLAVVNDVPCSVCHEKICGCLADFQSRTGIMAMSDNSVCDSCCFLTASSSFVVRNFYSYGFAAGFARSRLSSLLHFPLTDVRKLPLVAPQVGFHRGSNRIPRHVIDSYTSDKGSGVVALLDNSVYVVYYSYWLGVVTNFEDDFECIKFLRGLHSNNNVEPWDAPVAVPSNINHLVSHWWSVRLAPEDVVSEYVRYSFFKAPDHSGLRDTTDVSRFPPSEYDFSCGYTDNGDYSLTSEHKYLLFRLWLITSVHKCQHVFLRSEQIESVVDLLCSRSARCLPWQAVVDLITIAATGKVFLHPNKALYAAWEKIVKPKFDLSPIADLTLVYPSHVYYMRQFEPSPPYYVDPTKED